jgi:hypothetical protein
VKVLVAIPARASTPKELLDSSEAIYESLTFSDRTRALFVNDYPAAKGKYANNARARNELLDLYLTPEYTHILWLDVDLVEVPRDIIEKLAEVGEEHIVAPFVVMEPNRLFGDCRFYDVGGFVKDGKGFDLHPPYCDGGNLVEMDSVGSCYLIPVDIYRIGARYEPEGDEVEHVSLMRSAREKGYQVFARRDVTVLHAFLPKYGDTLR